MHDRYPQLSFTYPQFSFKNEQPFTCARDVVCVYCHYTDRGAEKFSNNGCHVCKRGELKISEMVPLPLGTRLTLGDGSGDRVPVKPTRPNPLTSERDS